MIIGIVGFIGSGKNTVGDFLANIYGFKKESFAKPLKDAASDIFGWPRYLLEGDTDDSREFRETVDSYWSKILNKPNFTPRLALQLLGTQAGRDVFGENIWTASCIRRCCTGEFQYKTVVENYVITDCRFRNEISAINEANGIVIRVKRGPDPDWASRWQTIPTHTDLTNYMKTTHPEVHQSEWDWVGAPGIQYVIENDGTIADLQKKVYDILVDLKVTQKPYKEFLFAENLK